MGDLTGKARIYLPIFISKRICVALDERWSITNLLEPQGGGWEDIRVPRNVHAHGWCHKQNMDICLEAPPRARRLYKTLWFGCALGDTHHIHTYTYVYNDIHMYVHIGLNIIVSSLAVMETFLFLLSTFLMLLVFFAFFFVPDQKRK